MDTSLRYCVHLGSWIHTTFYPVGSEGSFSADKACDSEHSPPSSVKVNMWRYTTASPYVFIMQGSMKHSDEFTFGGISCLLLPILTYRPFVCIGLEGTGTLVRTPMGQLLAYQFRTSNMRNATGNLRQAFCLLAYIEICQLHTLYCEIMENVTLVGVIKVMNTKF